MRKDSDAAMFLTCEPEEVGRITIPATSRAHRGDLVIGTGRPAGPGLKPTRREPPPESDEYYAPGDDEDDS
jgi:hypothetical protein